MCINKFCNILVSTILAITFQIAGAQDISKDIKDKIVNLYNESQVSLSEGNFPKAIELKTNVYNESKNLDGLKLIGALCAFEIAQYHATVNNDLDKYIDWLKKSEQCGFSAASGRLGDAYLSGTDGVEKDYQKAKYYYDKSNEGRCKWIIATMYTENGELGRNDSEYLKYANMAVDKGEPDAQFYLGLSYIYGKIVQKDFRKGVDLIKKSAQQNNIKAIRFLEENNIK